MYTMRVHSDGDAFVTIGDNRFGEFLSEELLP
jgi:hypothetical protein